jgi:hypothetical protein
MRIECVLCPYISEDEEDFENHFMEESNPLHGRTTKEDTRISNKSVIKAAKVVQRKPTCLLFLIS